MLFLSLFIFSPSHLHNIHKLSHVSKTLNWPEPRSDRWESLGARFPLQFFRDQQQLWSTAWPRCAVALWSRDNVQINGQLFEP